MDGMEITNVMKKLFSNQSTSSNTEDKQVWLNEFVRKRRDQAIFSVDVLNLNTVSGCVKAAASLKWFVLPTVDGGHWGRTAV